MDKTATDERCARCGCTPMEHHKLHCEGRDGNCMCHGGWREPGSMLTEVDRVAQAQNAEYDAEAADEDYFSDLTARLAAADQAWAEKHDCPPAYPHYIRWLAKQVDAFADLASPAAPADDEALSARGDTAPQVSSGPLALAIYQGGLAAGCHQNTIARNLLARYDIRERGETG